MAYAQVEPASVWWSTPGAWLAVAALGIALLVFAWWIGASRRLKGLRADMLAGFHAFDNTLLQRLALTKELEAVASRAMRHERATVVHLMQARLSTEVAAAAAAASPGEPMQMATLAGAEVRLVEALRLMIDLADAYPDLRSDPRMQELIQALRDGRAPLAAARQAFDDAVEAYNAAIGRSPARLVARLLRLRPLTGLNEGRNVNA